MVDQNNAGCCSASPGCCGSIPIKLAEEKRLVIDFLYLDLSVCTRCQGTDSSLDEALAEVVFAYRKDDLDNNDMESMAAFGKIVKNYLKINNLYGNSK